MRIFVFGLIALGLAGCAGSVGSEGSRWFSAERRSVDIEGIPYNVDYVRADGGVDLRSHRDQFLVVSADPMVERRRNTQAAMIVAKSVCPGAIMESEQKDGDRFLTRARCS